MHVLCVYVIRYKLVNTNSLQRETEADKATLDTARPSTGKGMQHTPPARMADQFTEMGTGATGVEGMGANGTKGWEVMVSGGRG